jgi:hypothetical protein
LRFRCFGLRLPPRPVRPLLLAVPPQNFCHLIQTHFTINQRIWGNNKTDDETEGTRSYILDEPASDPAESKKQRGKRAKKKAALLV